MGDNTDRPLEMLRSWSVANLVGILLVVVAAWLAKDLTEHMVLTAAVGSVVEVADFRRGRGHDHTDGNNSN